MSFIEKENGIKIAYELCIKDNTSPFIVILVHGTCGHKNNLFFPEVARILRFNSIRFDFQGNGDSEGEFLIGGFDRDVEDLKDVVNWCSCKGYEVIGIVGHSKAGSTVLIYGGLYDVPLVVPISARMDMSVIPNFIVPYLPQVYVDGQAVASLGGKNFVINKEGIEERKNLDMVGIVKKVKSSVVVIHGREDDMTSVNDSEHIENLLGEKCLRRVVIENTGHFFEGKAEEIVEAVNSSCERMISKPRL